jgi:hypothetical protein
MNVVQLHPLEKAAKRYWGVTKDLHETGFILSDGTFLDLSGGVRGRRTREHSALPDEIKRALGKSGHVGLAAFLQQTGVIRVVPALGIAVGRMPTVEAITAFVAGWKRAYGDDSVTVDIMPDDYTLISQEIDPEVDTLVEFMDANFNSPSMGATAQRLQLFSDCVNWPEDQVDDLKAMIEASETISRTTFLKSVDSGEMKELEEHLGYERDPRRGLTMAKDWHVAYYRSTLRGCPAVYFKWSAIEHVFTDLTCIRPPATMGATENVAPILYHGTLKEYLPAILEQGIAQGEGWGGANTSGAFLSKTPEGALYWAKMAYQRGHGGKLEAYKFDLDHGLEVDDLLAVLVVQVPDAQVDRLRADEEQFEDVHADFPADDWRQSLEKIGDARFDGEIPRAWIRDVIQPSAIEN